MTDWLLEVIRWAGIVCGIAGGMALVHALVLFQYRRKAVGYMRLALRELKPFLFTVFLVELLIGTFFFLTSLVWAYFPYPAGLLFAVMTGMLSAFFPYALEGAFLGRRVFFLGLRRRLTRLMRRLNLAVRDEIAREIAMFRQRDNLDCQTDGWGTGVGPVDVGRRLRILYEMNKEAIAMERRDPSFLYYDHGRNPWEKFYLLVRFLGRDELHHRLTNPPPSPTWDGRERRLRPVRGSKGDRGKPDPNPDRQRCYDNPELIKRIRAGKSWFLSGGGDRSV